MLETGSSTSEKSHHRASCTSGRPRSPRLSVLETADLVKRIPILQDIFRPKDVTTTGESISSGPITQGPFKASKDDVFSTDSILYLSRYNKESFSSTSKETGKKSDRSAEAEDQNDTNNKMPEKRESTIPSQNREKKRRFAISLATLASKPSKRATIVKEGAIPVIIDMSLIDDEIIQRSCASALSYLAKEAAFRQAMIEANAFAGIIALSNCPIRAVKADCLRALCNLCCHPGSEGRAVKDNAPATVTAIAEAYPELLEICLKTLLNISCVPDRLPRHEDITEALLQLFALELTVEQEVLMLQIISNLSATRGYQTKVVEDGCVRIVEKLLKSPFDQLRIIAAEIIRNFTTEPKALGKLVENNVISMLLVMSKDELEVVKTACVRAFFNLAGDTSCREKIVSGNAVSVIIRMSTEKFSNVERGRTAARTLRTLCTDRQIANRLVRDGIVKALMSLLRTDDRVIQQFCAESICSLFQISEVLGRLVEQGAVVVLVQLSSNISDAVTGEWCAFALYHLATNEICPTAMLENGIMPCLVKLCEVNPDSALSPKPSTDGGQVQPRRPRSTLSESPNKAPPVFENKLSTPTTKYFCAAAFAHISQIKVVNSSSAIPILVHMLDNEADQVTKSNCAAALYNMADIDENCNMMLKAGALMPVVSLTQSEDGQTKMRCAAILSRLSLHKEYYNEFAADGVLKVLLDLSKVDHVLTQRRVVIALSNLSQSPVLRERLLDLKPIPFIIHLASKRDENLRRGCAAIVCNLAYRDGNERAIVNAGIIPTLLITAMITSDQVHSKVICVKALVNLMADRSLYKTLVAEGLIWSLSSLAHIDHPELPMLCAKALCCFTVDFAKEMLTSKPIETLMMLIGKPDLELQRAGARALTNLLLQTTDADEAFRKKAVESMELLAQSNDEEISEMCVYCLCLASQSESCREKIVESGMLSMIDSSAIFMVPQLSYAYLTMVVNIANNSEMRTKLLDDRPDRTMQRFMQICMAEESYLHLAVAKAIYSISCSSDNVSKMAQHNVLLLISKIWERDFEKPFELKHLLVACLYNMSTEVDAQSRLVSQGYVRVVMQLWDSIKDEWKLCALAVQAICHMACGNTNTARMVEEGCAPVLCSVSSGWVEVAYKLRVARLDMYRRAAMALRNLLCVVSNQEPLVMEGCIETLIHIAKDAESDFNLSGLRKTSTEAITSPSSGRHRVHSRATHIVDGPELEIRQHCASALRCITYNKELRDELTNSGAVAILLDDLKADMEGDAFSIGYDLLCELEAESWENGTRGRKKDGRAPPIQTAPMMTDLMKGSPNVQLDVQLRYGDLEKCHVQVQLDEPKIELEAANIIVDKGLDNLAAFTDYEDQNVALAPCNFPKQECSIVDSSSRIASRALSFTASAGSADAYDDELDDGTIGFHRAIHDAVTALESPSEPLTTSVSFVKESNGSQQSMIIPSKVVAKKGVDTRASASNNVAFAAETVIFGSPTSSIDQSLSASFSLPDVSKSFINNKTQAPPAPPASNSDRRKISTLSSESLDLPKIPPAMKQQQQHHQSNSFKNQTNPLKSQGNNLADAQQRSSRKIGSTHRTHQVHPTTYKEEQLKTLVAMIKHTKQTRGPIDEVLSKYAALPKY